MKLTYTIVAITIAILAIQGCDLLKSTFDKQVDTCVADARLGLGDPESLELLSSEGIDLDNGWFRVEIKYTAKNAMGGRVRGSTICGFKDKKSIELNAEDIMNEQRTLFRHLKELGIRIR